MDSVTYLNNQFLIAMPNLDDPNFFHSVTLMCQHNDEGALGITINRPTAMELGEIFMQMGITAVDPECNKTPVFAGGPVQQERGFILHSPELDNQWDSTIPVSDTISLTTSKDILEAIAQNEGPKNFLVALGYAGWGVGQLEKEITANSWLHTPCLNNVLFNTPIDQRWSVAANQLGVDISLLTMPAGHG